MFTIMNNHNTYMYVHMFQVGSWTSSLNEPSRHILSVVPWRSESPAWKLPYLCMKMSPNLHENVHNLTVKRSLTPSKRSLAACIRSEFAWKRHPICMKTPNFCMKTPEPKKKKFKPAKPAHIVPITNCYIRMFKSLIWTSLKSRFCKSLRQKLLNLFLDFLICSDVPMMKISLPIIMVGGGWWWWVVVVVVTLKVWRSIKLRGLIRAKALSWE